MTGTEFIYPDWPAPARVRAFVTTRQGGVSSGRYSSLNLAQHVEDDVAAVEQNRQLLKQALQLPSEPVWLDQVHGVKAVRADDRAVPTVADASYTTEPDVVCAVMTADCLPVLICNRQGNKVAAAHAGWRGLQAGVIEQTIEVMQEDVGNLLVWLGPAIGPDAFEVGEEVKLAFEADLPDASAAFRETRPGHWLADIYLLARQRLNHMGVEAVYGGGFCTFNNKQQFFSYRRDGKTGRMASLIYIAGDKI